VWYILTCWGTVSFSRMIAFRAVSDVFRYKLPQTIVIFKVWHNHVWYKMIFTYCNLVSAQWSVNNSVHLHICDFHQTDRKVSCQIYGTASALFLHKIQYSYLQTFLNFSKIRKDKCAFHMTAAFFVLPKLIWYVFFKPGLNFTGHTLRVTENSQPRYVSADIFNVYRELCQVIKRPVLP